MNRARTLTGSARSCNDMQRLGQEHSSPLSGSLGKVNLKNLPVKMRNLIQFLKPGQPSNPVRIADGVAVFMVCDRNVQKTSAEDLRNQIKNSLIAQRQQAVARRRIRDLRRAAFLDVRL